MRCRAAEPTPLVRLLTLLVPLTLATWCVQLPAAPLPVEPLQDGDSVLFIGNSFSDWSGPLPNVIQKLITASGSGLDVHFTIKVKGMGILKEYATWSSLGMIDEIQKGGWKYVVIQGWEDAISRKDAQQTEGGTPITDYIGWPACQDTMLKYLQVLDAEVRAVGATTILYEPHVGASGYLTNLDRSNQTYAMLQSQVDCFHAPVIMAWDSLRYRYPTDEYICGGSPGSFIDLFYADCGHQNADGMLLDAMTFYGIFTHRSTSTLEPVVSTAHPEMYEELAGIAYNTAKTILEHNSCGFTDSEAPSTPGGLQASNIMPDSYRLTWDASTDNVGVLGYRVFRDGTPVDTVAVTQCMVTGLAAATQYAMTVEAFDSEGNVSSPSSALDVTTGANVSVDTNGVLLQWCFDGLGGTQSVPAQEVMTGMSSSAPGGVIDAGSVFLPNTFNGGNSFSMSRQTATSLAGAITADQYFTFSVAPLAGNAISIDSILLCPFSQNQARNFTLMSDVAGFTAGNEIGSTSSTGTQTLAVTGHDDLSGAVEFRVYVWGPENQWESFGLGNNATDGQADLQVWGGVVSGATPAFPTNLRVTDLTETGFTLHWNASDDAVSYEVFRDGSSEGTTTDLFLAVTGVTINDEYAMTVVATLGAGGTSESSLPLQVTIPDQSAPSVPQNLTADAITENSFTLHWDASTDNVAVARYEIVMDGEEFGNTVDGYLPVPYLTPNTTYAMQVRAVDAAGNPSALSGSIDVTTLPGTAAVQDLSIPRLQGIRLVTHGSVREVSLSGVSGGEPVDVVVFGLQGQVVARHEGVSDGQTVCLTHTGHAVELVQIRGRHGGRVVRLLP